jgi:hypothetical protein
MGFKTQFMELLELIGLLHGKDLHFRLEDDENGFYLSIIDRSKYPRVWADNFQSQQSFIVAETVENIINKTVLAENDWLVRCEGETLDECVEECYNWLTCHNLI